MRLQTNLTPKLTIRALMIYICITEIIRKDNKFINTITCIRFENRLPDRVAILPCRVSL